MMIIKIIIKVVQAIVIIMLEIKKDKDIILIDPVSFNVTIIKKDEKKERYILV